MLSIGPIQGPIKTCFSTLQGENGGKEEEVILIQCVVFVLDVFCCFNKKTSITMMCETLILWET